MSEGTTNVITTILSLAFFIVGGISLSDDFPIGALRKIGFRMDKYPDLEYYEYPARTVEEGSLAQYLKLDNLEGGLEITVKNCPDILLGRTGLHSVDWSKEYNFQRLNKRVYKKIMKPSFSKDKIRLVIKLNREDKYGKEYFDSYTVGYLDPSEARKYKDFETWERDNDLEPQIKDFIIKLYEGK